MVDFKGGATFAGMADLPHVSAMIFNLESELALVDRMEDALRGDYFEEAFFSKYMGGFAEKLGISWQDFIDMGRTNPGS